MSFLTKHKKKIIFWFLAIVFLVGAFYVVFDGPRFSPPNCGWDDLINGNCDSKGYVLLTKEEIYDIMKKKNVSKEEVLKQVEWEIEQVKSEINEEREQEDEHSGQLDSLNNQLRRLEGIKHILQAEKE